MNNIQTENINGLDTGAITVLKQFMIGLAW